MRIMLHIGPAELGADRLQAVLAEKREGLESKGILFPRCAGGTNHTRLFMAVTDPDHIDPLRYNRGLIAPDKQAALRETLLIELQRDIDRAKPDILILSASQLGGSLARRSELERLRDLLTPLSDDIRIIAHIDEPARLLARVYAAQVMEGRAYPLDRELALAESADWWQGALDQMGPIDPQAGNFLETQAPPFWLDFQALQEFWEDVFGAGSLTFRAYYPKVFASEDVTEEIRAGFGIEVNIGKAAAARLPDQPSAAWLSRARRMNALLLQVLEPRKRILPRLLWRSFLQEFSVPGDPIDPATLGAISKRFKTANAALAKAHGLPADLFKAPRAKAAWNEADPMYGFRASQYLLGFMWRINKATKEERQARRAALAQAAGAEPDTTVKPISNNGLSDEAKAVMPPLAMQKFQSLQGSPYAPHNRIGAVNEEELAAAFTPAPQRPLTAGSTGNVIVGCMKNEAPYIVEWIAYHRAVGVDNFLIYTNDCSDGTEEILQRLDQMGIVQHRNNDKWKGNSPQQYALNQAMKEPVVTNADWIIHIDVDEFINVRTGNGTLEDFFARVPDATNVAMTWRLFGHNGVTALKDDLVIDQFDTCAPKYCPKPHTVWGFKTMFKNIGAYGKLSCHRPNKLDATRADRVKWVNGSGQDMTREAIKNGWRSSKKSIGYDLLQLNHYALRSAESFLIKRQRGRALHVDRSIGLNYWIRMDWSNFRDITIKRNIPRVRAEYDRLMQDEALKTLHDQGFAWHRAKADELHGIPEFQELYTQALKVKLTETERVAYALALDMES
ncbi:glycosyltransferase family 2 protein [Aestuariivita boseongensis]|uniref:glycosyltransferase family 2 protein n=1 Tax=Aestuariivita boseongensis TaxID=1470562 RepID=UPI0006834F9A|nr:glycosyltransferase family 2 protein [Aestuariivita boseongensis]